jgi:hypothetical protein
MTTKIIPDEKIFADHIKNLRPEDWRPLLDLIPEIERTTCFGKTSGGQEDTDGYIQMPYWIPSQVVERFHDVVYDIPVVFSFDWMKWDEGRKLLSDENTEFDSLDLLTKCKLITAIVRNNRFCDGYLVSAFESGLILKILKAIERDVTYETHRVSS